MRSSPDRPTTVVAASPRPWQARKKREERWVRLLTIPVYLGCGLAFVGDITQEIFVNFGLFYIPLVCTAVLHRNRNAAWWLAGLATTMIVLGFFFPVINPDHAVAATNRMLSITTVFITAALVQYARNIQERLADETKRAEAAERLTSDIFTSLSEEIRKPLHAVVGLCGVMMANCRPDQREPLGRVQSSSKQLVEMIENLIDLAHIDRRPIRVEPVDVDRMVHEAADAIRPTAADKQIAVAVDPEPGPPRIVQADAWAIRRILDNLLANALRFSPRGAVVELVTETQPDRVEVIVRDTGVGMPSDALRRLEEPLPPIEADRGSPDDATDTGLTLSRRLARAIGAELVFDSEPGSGTTVTLRLPN